APKRKLGASATRAAHLRLKPTQSGTWRGSLCVRMGFCGRRRTEPLSEIFISYARPNEAEARRIADALRTRGWGVWRDDELPPHRAYAEVIEERLRSAKAVVVVWTTDAAKSQWVRAEADIGRERGTLVQLTLDGAIPPLPFNQIQCADLQGWRG